jgi:hypothetical protein
MANEVEKLQRRLEKALSKTFGKRCEIKDIEDFPELKNPKNGRCPVCVVYEELDQFVLNIVKRLS